MTIVSPTDPNVVYYGPYPCAECGVQIIAPAKHDADVPCTPILDYPTNGPVYPNSPWVKHVCRADRPERPSQYVGFTTPMTPEEKTAWASGKPAETAQERAREFLNKNPMPGTYGEAAAIRESRHHHMRRDSECFMKAKDNGELTFTVVEHDQTAPDTICFWIGKNISTAPIEKLIEALRAAHLMARYPRRRHAD